MAISVAAKPVRSLLHDLEPLSLQFECYGQSQVRAFLRLDPIRASPIRIVFLWVIVKGRANGEFDRIPRIIRRLPNLGR
jgi:hypothetical protein